MSLARVETALKKGDPVAALGHALTAWASCKHERIVFVIEELSRRAAKGREAPGGKTVAQKQAAWLSLAAKRDPADLEHLLATLSAIKKKPELEARLAALARRPPDPRIASALHALLEEPSLKMVLRAILDLLSKIGDPRSIRPVGDLHTRKLPVALRRHATTTVSAIYATWDEVSPDERRIAAVERLLDGPSGVGRVPELFAAVYANPEDDSVRAVLADALQEVGDPRGEFITLQLMRGRDGTRTKREVALLKEHGRAWLGPLASMLDREHLVFERGFLANCRIESGEAALSSHVLWTTVEAIELDGWQHVQPLVASMPVLRSFANQSGRLVPSHPRIETISIDHLLESEVPHLVSRELPSLRSFEIRECHNRLQMAAFLSSPFATQLRSLSVGVKDLAAWIATFAERRFERASVRDPAIPWALIFEGDRIVCEYQNFGARNPVRIAAALVRLLDDVPTPSRWHLAIAERFHGQEALQSTFQRFASVAVAEVEVAGVKLLFIVDPLEKLGLAGDTSYALMLEACDRGWEVYTCQLEHLGMIHDEATATAVRTMVTEAETPAEAFTVGDSQEFRLGEFDIVMMRKDPPVDVAFLHATWILEHARGKTLLVNDPRGLRDLNEHLAVLRFPSITPPTIVTRDAAKLRAFQQDCGGAIVVKPVDGYGGLGIFVVKDGDMNASSIIETATGAGTRWTIAQKYLPDAVNGDKRILLADGEYMGAVLRVPAQAEARGNLHVGGKAVKTELTDRDREIIATVAPTLKSFGQVFVGLDVIGGYLTELNITSPTGVRHVARLEERNVAGPILEKFEALVRASAR